MSASSQALLKMASKPPPARLDDFYSRGRYTWLVVLMAELTVLVECGHMYFMLFAGHTPKITSCGGEEEDGRSTCDLYMAGQCGTNRTLSYQFHSINVDWNFLCKDSSAVKSGTSSQMFGVLLGSVIFGQLSDIVGRKPTLMFTLAVTSVLSYLITFSNSLVSFLIYRFFISMVVGGHTSVITVMLIESLPKRDRMWISQVISWSPNVMLFALLAYVTGDWRSLSTALSLISLLPTVLMIFVQETPHYLMRRGRLDDARTVIKKIVTWSKQPFDGDSLDRVLEHERQLIASQNDTATNYTFWHLFYSWKLVRYSLTVGLSYFAVSLVNYALVFNFESLSGTIYSSIAISGVIRWTMNIVFAIGDYYIPKLGRHPMHAFASIYTTTSLAVVVVALWFGVDKSHMWMRILIISVSSVVTQLYIVNGVALNEIYPTPIRNTAFAFGQMCSRIGVVVAPIFFFLSSVWELLPYVIMLALMASETSAFLTLIPESKGRPLPDHMPPRSKRIFGRKLSNPDDATSPSELQDINPSKA